MSGYPTSTSLPRVDGLLTDPQVLGRNKLGVHLAVILRSVFGLSNS